MSATGDSGIDLSFPSNLIDPTDQPIFYQITMVFIGIREYTPGLYPAQTGLLSDDGFIFNAIKT